MTNLLVNRQATSWLPQSLRSRFCVTVLAAGLVLTAGPVQKVWAFGAEGHEIVADLAGLNLQQDAQGQAALARIKDILDHDETMADASTWADRIKGGGFDDESNAFITKVKNTLGKEGAHKPWHYVDVPFQATEYSRRDPWTRPDDVVQMIRICAQTLRDGASPADSPIPLTQQEALRLLIHYTGDLEQPLHVGCGYINSQNQFVMPVPEELAAGTVKDDQGGNLLDFTRNGKPTRLHAYWDSDAVALAMNGKSVPDYVTYSFKTDTSQPDWAGNGNMESWPIQWANDSLKSAATAYTGLTITAPAARGWEITVPGDYDLTSQTLVETNMAKGGYRLAQILKEVLAPAAAPNPA